jgi:YfiH family protein
MACWAFTDRADGDFAIEVATDDLRAGVVPGRWSWLRQVHGADVRVVRRPGEHAGEEGDALVTRVAGAPLAVQTADCGGVVLVSPEGVVGVAHAGWRGLAAGVVADTVAAMRELGAVSIEARLGPMIHPECYEFGAEDLDAVAAALGPVVRSQTAAGAPALDVPAAVEAALAAEGVRVVEGSPGCTACHPERWFSHRARQESGRMAAVVWLEGPE